MERQTRHRRVTCRRTVAPVKVAVAVLPLVLVILAGCGLDESAHNGGKVGPQYTRPAGRRRGQLDRLPGPPHQERGTTGPEPLVECLQDPVLNSLVEEAYQQNLNLRQAGERIMQARARRGIAVGNLFPQSSRRRATTTQQGEQGSANSGGTDSGSRTGTPGSTCRGNWTYGAASAGRSRPPTPTWTRRSRISTTCWSCSSPTSRRTTSSTATFQERIALAAERQIQEKSYQLAQDKFQAGAATERDAQQAKQVLEQTRASIPQLEAGTRQTTNALCVLLGKPPSDLSARLGGSARHPGRRRRVALGIPADLLRRRPDVRRAERLAAAQSALIGVAKSDLYPRFFLIGSIGVQAERLRRPVRDPGQHDRVHRPGVPVEHPELRPDREQRGTAGGAGSANSSTPTRTRCCGPSQEAEDAAVDFLKAQERVQFLNASVVAAGRTVEITYDQYRDGVIDFTPVFLFEGTLTQQQDDLAVARGQIALSLVDLYRSLGGGWEIRLHEDSGRPAAPQPATQPGVPLEPPASLPASRPLPNAAGGGAGGGSPAGRYGADHDRAGRRRRARRPPRIPRLRRCRHQRCRRPKRPPPRRRRSPLRRRSRLRQIPAGGGPGR